MKLFLWVCILMLVVSGCANTVEDDTSNHHQELSDGAQLLIDTHIMTREEIALFVQEHLPEQGSQLKWEKLNHWDSGISLDSSLEWHPALYPYFFVTGCQSVGCVQEKFIDMGRSFTEAYMHDPRVLAQKHLFRPLKIVRSDWVVNQAMIEAIDLEPHNIKKKVGVYLRLRNFDQINQHDNLWGNDDPREQPDGFSSKVLDDVERAKMLIEVSKQHPDILTFVGISQRRLKAKKSCFGGFFVKAGQVTSVPELGCNDLL